MKVTAMFMGLVPFFSLLWSVAADNHDTCICVAGAALDYCATNQACGNISQNHRAIAIDGWCDAEDMPIDGNEFYNNCQSKGAFDSCCINKDGTKFSYGCPPRAKRSIQTLYKRAQEEGTSVSLSDLKAAIHSHVEKRQERLPVRDIKISCISPYGSTYKLTVIDIAVTLGRGLLTFAIDNIINGGLVADVAIQFLSGSTEVGKETLHFRDGGVKTLPIPAGADGVRFSSP